MKRAKGSGNASAKKLTAMPPREPEPAPVGAVNRSWAEIMMATNHLNSNIRKADQGRRTLREPSPRTRTETPRSCAVM